MPRGASDVPELRLSRLNKLVTNFTAPPAAILSALFGTDDEESDQIKWESQVGNRGMSPIIPPGSKAPLHAPQGVAPHTASAAYIAEKSFFDEEFLNNLRQEGTEAQYLTAKKRLAREMKSLANRCDRRVEWMHAKMLVEGELEYLGKGGVKLDVDYAIPSANKVTLGADYKWDAGTKRDILSDIMDAKIQISNLCNGIVDYALVNSTVLKWMALDDSIQTLLQKSAFGQGDLFKKVGGKIIGVNARVLGNLLDIQNLVVYDEKYVVGQILTAALAVGGTTVYVGDTADFETGTAVLHDVSEGTSEEVTISALNTEAGTLTVSASTGAYKAGEDKITMTKSFIPDTKFVMFASQVDGQKIAEFKRSPFGLGRHWGRYVDQWDTKDPDGIYLRVQNKGLPVLYQRDAVYVLTVT